MADTAASLTLEISGLFSGTLLSESSAFSILVAVLLLLQGLASSAPARLWKNKLLLGMGRKQGTRKATEADASVMMTR